jgi:hypothetical protein
MSQVSWGATLYREIKERAMLTTDDQLKEEIEMTKSIRNSTGNPGLVLTIIFIVLTTGCMTSGYKDPISRFQSASSVVIASTRIYIIELNKVERDHYIANKLSKKAQIRLDELESVQVFSQDGLKARLDALNQLTRYGNLLSKLANSDAPDRIKAEAQNLGESMKKLSGTVSELIDADDIAFKSAVGPVTTIIGEILTLVIQQKIKEALDKCIKDGETPINSLLSVIRSDVSIAYERKRQSLSDIRVGLVDEYSREISRGTKADGEKLRLYAERIRDHENQWEVFASANPGEGLDAMVKAHTALINYAKSRHNATDLASLVEAMEAFAARAVNIGQAVQALRGN